ncbi:MAG TPA: type II CAAX endopeptidase family protein [Acidimicrobiia bacterium]|nr:type II CAAX endopeptidase family protein [Acidimicrobiia bacterium]
MTDSPMRRVGIFFLLAFAITWVVWVPRAINPGGFFDRGAGEILGTVWSYGPALAAVVAARVFDGRSGLRELGSRLKNWRVGWIWYVVAILGPLLLVLLTGLSTVAAGGTMGEVMSDVLDEGIVSVLFFLVVLALTDGLGEETGWRGYALPRLLEVTGAVGASLGLGVIWALWHLPLFWTDGSSLFETSVLVLFLRLPATSIMFTWLFQKTQGSLLLAILFHATLNLYAAPPGESLRAGLVGVAVHWVVAILLIPQVRRWDQAGVGSVGQASR